MKVKITITSDVGGVEQVFRTHGELEFEGGGFVARYRLEGDDCMLEYDGKRAVQRRSGHLTFIMEFISLTPTECVLSEGGTKFAFPVFTNVLSAEVVRDGCSLDISYIQGDEAEPTRVRFAAVNWRERNEKRPSRHI